MATKMAKAPLDNPAGLFTALKKGELSHYFRDTFSGTSQIGCKIAAAERIYLKVPVTSVKEWGKYVHGVAAEFKRPPFAVITTISAVPDDKTQFKVTWKCKGKVGDPEAVQALIAAHKADEKTIGFPYPAASDAAPEKQSEKF